MWWPSFYQVLDATVAFETVNAVKYNLQLGELKAAITRKRHELANRCGVVFHHDNAKPQMGHSSSSSIFSRPCPIWLLPISLWKIFFWMKSLGLWKPSKFTSINFSPIINLGFGARAPCNYLRDEPRSLSKAVHICLNKVALWVKYCILNLHRRFETNFLDNLIKELIIDIAQEVEVKITQCQW